MLRHGPPRHRRGACGAVTAHHTPVAAWPKTVKGSESWALSLGFMACVLGMRPPECFLSIHPSIPPSAPPPPPLPRGPLANGLWRGGGLVVGVQTRGTPPAGARAFKVINATRESGMYVGVPGTTAWLPPPPRAPLRPPPLSGGHTPPFHEAKMFKGCRGQGLHLGTDHATPLPVSSLSLLIFSENPPSLPHWGRVAFKV